MGMPEIPDIRPKIDIDKEDVINLLLISIALEELSLAHIVNAEAEKIQKVIEDCSSLKELMEIDEAVGRILKDVIKKEMLLQFKFENILDLLKLKKYSC